MATRQRVKLEVYVDLDPIPGAFHSKESARNFVDGILKANIPHYNPMVSTTGDQYTYIVADPAGVRTVSD